MGYSYKGWPMSCEATLNYFEKLWQSADSCWWEEANATLIFRKGKKALLEKYRTASLTLIPENVMEQLILKIISKHLKAKKVIRNSQEQMYKLCLTKLITSQTNWQSEVQTGGQWGDLKTVWPLGSNTCHLWHEVQSPVVCTWNSYWG